MRGRQLLSSRRRRAARGAVSIAGRRCSCSSEQCYSSSLSVRSGGRCAGSTRTTVQAGWSLGVLYGIIVVWVIVVVFTMRRATAGVGGRSARRQRVQGAAFATVWTAVYVFQGALHHAGASHAIAYGIYPATAPFIIVGSAAAGTAAAQENWRDVCLAIAVIAVASGAAFAGAALVWLVMGIGLSAVLLALAALQIWQRIAVHA